MRISLHCFAALLLLCACQDSADGADALLTDASQTDDHADASEATGQSSEGVIDPVGNVSCSCDAAGHCNVMYSGKSIDVEQGAGSQYTVHDIVVVANGRCVERAAN
jgi:hypothetical protein